MARRGLSGQMQPPPDARWRAQRDAVGHAFLRHPLARETLCGVPRWDERWDWTVETRCEACTAALNELTKAALRGPAAEQLGL